MRINNRKRSIISVGPTVSSNSISQVINEPGVNQSSSNRFIKNISRVSQSPKRMTSLKRKLNSHFESKQDTIEKQRGSINKLYKNEMLSESVSPSKNTALHDIAKSQVMAANNKFTGSNAKLVFEKYRGVSMVDTRPTLPTRNKI